MERRAEPSGSSSPVGDENKVICNELTVRKAKGKTIDSPLQEPFQQS